VVEVPKQLHLAQRPQAEHGVVEGCDLLDGDLLAGRLVQRRAVSVSAIVLPRRPVLCSPYYAVCALADHILDVVLLRYVEGYLPRAAASCGRHVCGWCGSKRLCAVVGAVRSSSARRGAAAGRGAGEQRDGDFANSGAIGVSGRRGRTRRAGSRCIFCDCRRLCQKSW
jgi:hypothetical protein